MPPTITRRTFRGLVGVLFAAFLFLAGADARRVAVEIVIAPLPGALAWTVFRLSIGPALVLTAPVAAGVILGVVLGRHGVLAFKSDAPCGAAHLGATSAVSQRTSFGTPPAERGEPQSHAGGVRVRIRERQFSLGYSSTPDFAAYASPGWLTGSPSDSNPPTNPPQPSPGSRSGAVTTRRRTGPSLSIR